MSNKEAEHIITFLRRVQKFANDNTFTSTLKVDEDNTVEDLHDIFKTMTGELIAEMYNTSGELYNKLEQYYIDTKNEKALKRLHKLKI